MSLIEFRNGQESHSSSWGKFYVKGLEKWQVREDFTRDKHESYTDFAAEVPDSTIFTIFSQSGDKRGTQNFDFYICEVRSPGDTPSNSIFGGHSRGNCKCVGNFLVLCRGEGKTKAPRLMDWWGKLAEKCSEFKNEEGLLKKGTKARFAFWCAEYLEKRGVKELPTMPVEYDPPIMATSVKPVEINPPTALSLSV